MTGRTGFNPLFWTYLYENNDYSLSGGSISKISGKKIISVDFWKALTTEEGDLSVHLYESVIPLHGVIANPDDTHFTANWTEVASSNQTNSPLLVNEWTTLEFTTPYTIKAGKYYYITIKLHSATAFSARFYNDDAVVVPQSAIDHGALPGGGNIWGALGGNAGYPLHRLRFEVCE
jgi:hypothetical protein